MRDMSESHMALDTIDTRAPFQSFLTLNTQSIWEAVWVTPANWPDAIDKDMQIRGCAVFDDTFNISH